MENFHSSVLCNPHQHPLMYALQSYSVNRKKRGTL